MTAIGSKGGYAKGTTVEVARSRAEIDSPLRVGAGAGAVLWFDPFLAYEISKEKNMVAKSKKVSKGVKKSKTKSPTIKTRTGMRGGSVSGAYRECGVCHKTGHNARSHEPGAKLALPPAKRR